MMENRATTEGRRLGAQLARLCDNALSGKPDNRCCTCAFRAGEHIANGSPETLMTAVKCLAEREAFWCHEHDRPCAGWLAMRFPPDGTVKVPWDYVEGADAPDSIALPDRSHEFPLPDVTPPCVVTLGERSGSIPADEAVERPRSSGVRG